uniref:Uncharacterized protein n=1 Tax=Manihot esculenta TaxID=3983 RepID=A0A2C9V5I5_MANES
MSSIVNDLTDAVIAPHLHSRFHHSIGMIAQNHLLMQKELHSFSPRSRAKDLVWGLSVDGWVGVWVFGLDFFLFARVINDSAQRGSLKPLECKVLKD